MHAFPRPAEAHLHVEREHVDGTCPECGGSELSAYRVMSEGGWWDVVKCQACLHSVSREPGPAFGSYTPLVAVLSR
jgi:hypothetical protein